MRRSDAKREGGRKEGQGDWGEIGVVERGNLRIAGAKGRDRVGSSRTTSAAAACACEAGEVLHDT